MENRLKRRLADALGARHLTAGNDVQYLLRGARADVERMKTLPVPRR